MLDHSAFAASFARLKKATPLRLRKIFQYFHGDLKRAWEEGGTDDFISAGIEPEAAQELSAERAKILPAQEAEHLKKFQTEAIYFGQKNYPALLKEIHNPPAVLFVRGKILPEDRFALGVVGSRVMSAYGKQSTDTIVSALVKHGLTIVSGLAAGVDSEAHRATLKVGGRTIAVLGCGADIFYPPQNKKLAEEILASGGAILSEYPLGTQPETFHFPQRNRIIAGLCRGVLVTEAREKSGALITAQVALEENREVFAVPGDIFRESSKGTNLLIQRGAQPVLSAENILATLELEGLSEKIAVEKIVPTNERESRLREILQKEPLHINELVRQSGLNSAEVSATLLFLEMKGLAKEVGGMLWVRG